MTVELQKVLYTAEAVVEGGRQGHGRTSDGRLEVDLSVPAEMSGDGGPGTNPEQLFAVGYAACFEGALGVVGRREKVELGEVSIESEVGLITTENRGFNVAVGLNVTLPGVTSTYGRDGNGNPLNRTDVDTTTQNTQGQSGFSDTNYIFLSFVTKYFPIGFIGLVIAVIFTATMSSSSGELNSLAAVSVMDIYRRHFKQNASDHHYLMASRDDLKKSNSFTNP